MKDVLKDFHEETKRIIAEANELSANGLQTSEDITKFARLMFQAGVSDCTHTMREHLTLAVFDRLDGFDGAVQ